MWPGAAGHHAASIPGSMVLRNTACRLKPPLANTTPPLTWMERRSPPCSSVTVSTPPTSPFKPRPIFSTDVCSASDTFLCRDNEYNSLPTSALPITRRVPRGWPSLSMPWRSSILMACLNDANDCVMASRWLMSVRSTIMPPSTVNSGMGGRISLNRSPSNLPSNGSGSSARPLSVEPPSSEM